MTELIIAAVAALIVVAASVRWHWWRLRTKGMPVLMYHKIGVPQKDSKLKKLWVSTKTFEKQLDWLLVRGYTTITLDDLAAYVRGGAALPIKPVLITFDDGYKNNYTEVFPLLKARNAKANIFVVAGYVGKADDWHNPQDESWHSLLTWEQLREMQDSGLVGIGSHTMTHACLTELEPERVSWQLRESKKRLEDGLGREVHSIAYPFGAGAQDEDIRQRAKDAGYLLDFSIKQAVEPLPLEGTPIHRIFVRGDGSMLDFRLQVTRGKSKF